MIGVTWNVFKICPKKKSHSIDTIELCQVGGLVQYRQKPSEIIYLKINNNWTTRTSFVEKLCALYIDDSPRKNEDHSRAVKSRIPIELGGKKICTFGCCGTWIAVDGSK